MSDSKEAVKLDNHPKPQPVASNQKYYRVKFRDGLQLHSADSKIKSLKAGEFVMVKTDHGMEPAQIAGNSFSFSDSEVAPQKKLATYNIIRRVSREEKDNFTTLLRREEEAFASCQKKITDLGLLMKLLRVERFFNGSNIIFYFTADNRVDFRALVKELVQEFRTRVEMRQVGVRHETKMLGGIGCCGRELCCASFMKKFVPVSIKMVKEQDLPLNPTKISGVCNRLLCCLTHEFPVYKACKKGMPKQGKVVELDGQQYKVTQRNILQETIKVQALDKRDDVRVLVRDEWEKIKVVGNVPRNKGHHPSKKSAVMKSGSNAASKQETQAKAGDKASAKSHNKAVAKDPSSNKRSKSRKTRRPRKPKKT